MLSIGEAVADGPDAAAYAIARVDDGDCSAQRDEVVGGCEAREARAGDDD